jgi:hypothetical protein
VGILCARLAGVWMGIDVGGERKGFDVAVLNDDLQLVHIGARLGVPAVVHLIRVWSPMVTRRPAHTLET